MAFFKKIGNYMGVGDDTANILTAGKKIDTTFNADTAKLANNLKITEKVANKADDVKAVKGVDDIKAVKGADGVVDEVKTVTKVDSNIEKVDDLSKNSKIIDWMKKNPGSTVGAAAAAVFGVATVAAASQDYDDYNNKVLTIVSMQPDKNSSGVIINYKPEAKFIYGDKIQIQQTNMIPSHENDILSVLTFPSSTSIVVNIPDIKTYATSGSFILKTTMTGRVLNSTGENAAVVTGKVGEVVSNSPIQTIIDYFKSLLYNFFGPYLKLIQGCCLCFCCLIIFSICYKIIRIFI